MSPLRSPKGRVDIGRVHLAAQNHPIIGERRLLEFRSDGAMYSALIQTALNAGHKAKAREIHGKANASLSDVEKEALTAFKTNLEN